ncbi:MAG: 5'/3'-nucleotidase SurE [Clostridia bacterium]|nr:5'/3'-nucleotidase SurE [Clostridia bacterium]
MKILVVNDDGILSEGIKTLADELSRENEIMVLAPNGNRSASSHSLTINSDVEFAECKISDNYRAFSLSGTPADCVKFAFHYFEGEKFDLVCSGINAGNNLGSDTLYSGTVSAGIEANYFGIPAIAFSNVALHGQKYGENAKVIRKIFDKLLSAARGDYTLNVNFPNLDANEIKGIKFAPLGLLRYSDYYAPTRKGAFRLMGEPLSDGIAEDNDVSLSSRGFVTITPIKYDRTDREAIEKLKEIKFL